jgi:hypothetical protein
VLQADQQASVDARLAAPCLPAAELPAGLAQARGEAVPAQACPAGGIQVGQGQAAADSLAVQGPEAAGIPAARERAAERQSACRLGARACPQRRLEGVEHLQLASRDEQAVCRAQGDEAAQVDELEASSVRRQEHQLGAVPQKLHQKPARQREPASDLQADAQAQLLRDWAPLDALHRPESPEPPDEVVQRPQQDAARRLVQLLVREMAQAGWRQRWTRLLQVTELEAMPQTPRGLQLEKQTSVPASACAPAGGPRDATGGPGAPPARRVRQCA